MPTVKLIKPSRLHLRGRLWQRDQPVHVNSEVARTYLNDARFEVSGLSGHATASVGSRPATLRGRKSALAAAMKKMPEDDADCWLPDGRPNRFALEALVGWPVDEELRSSLLPDTVDEAPAPAAEAPDDTPDDAPSETSKPRRPVVIRKAKPATKPEPSPPAPAPEPEPEPEPDDQPEDDPPEAAEATEADAPEKEPSVEV